jgi:hypothetical protein
MYVTKKQTDSLHRPPDSWTNTDFPLHSIPRRSHGLVHPMVWQHFNLVSTKADPTLKLS